MNHKTFYITYNGEKTQVDVDEISGARTFLVYIAGEDGHLNINIRTDVNGNENWYEGEQPTPRAKEIGELIEQQTM